MHCKGCYAKQFGPVSTSQTVNETAAQIKPFGGDKASNSNLVDKVGFNTNLGKKSEFGSGSLTKPTSQSNIKLGSDICPTCFKKVFFAEQIVGPGGVKYHKDTCFKCSVCRKALDSFTVAEKDTALFCKGDYQKLYGPHGNRVGVATLEARV
jgi:cysteine/glycine-rich protein